MKNEVENVLKFYRLTNTLKDKIRTGWKIWNVDGERLESVAEHIYGTCMVAIAMKSEYRIDVDLMKVIKMLVVHETEEIIIGDITLFDKVTPEEKKEMGHKAVREIFNGLNDKEEYVQLILEFDERKTKEALFAHMCDKFECDLQAMMYQEQGCMDVNNPKNKDVIKDERIQKLMEQGAKTIADFFHYYDMKFYKGEVGKPFREVIESVKD